MSAERRRRLAHALADVYQTIGFDMGWAEQSPTDEEFVDVLRDQLGNFADDLEPGDLEAFRALAFEEKRALILSVGP